MPGDPDDGTLAECEWGLYQPVNKGPLPAGAEPDFYIQCPKRGDLGSGGFGGKPEYKTHLEPVPATP